MAPLCPALRSTSGGIGAFVPQCEDDGSFSSVQCWGSTGYCWCVESTSGRPVTEGIRGIEPECPGKLDVYACRATPPSLSQISTLCFQLSWELVGGIPYSGKLSREITFTNFADLEPPVKVFLMKFGACRTHL